MSEIRYFRQRRIPRHIRHSREGGAASARNLVDAPCPSYKNGAEGGKIHELRFVPPDRPAAGSSSRSRTGNEGGNTDAATAAHPPVSRCPQRGKPSSFLP